MEIEKKLSPHCLACGSSEASIIATRNDGEIFLACQSCGSIYLEKIPIRVSDYYTVDYFALGCGQSVINQDEHTGHETSYEDTFLDAHFYWAFRLVDYIANILQPETASARRCLDIGAATGRLLSIFNAAGYETYGVELSDAALKIAAARGHIMSNQDFEEYSTQFSEFKVVTALEVIEHLEDLPKFFNGVYRVLADDGIFFGFFPSGDKRFFGLTDSYHWLHKSYEHLIYPSQEGIREAMRSNFGDEIYTATFLTSQGEDVIPNTIVVGLKKTPSLKVHQKIKTLFEELNTRANLNCNLSSPDLFERESQWIQEISNQTQDNFVDLPFVVSLICSKFGKNNSAEFLLQEEFDPTLLNDKQLLDLLIMAMHLGAFAYIRNLLKSISLRPLVSGIKKELRILVENFFYQLKSDELSNADLLASKYFELLNEYRTVSDLNDVHSRELQQNQVDLSRIRKVCFEYELENLRLGNRALKKLHNFLNKRFPFAQKSLVKLVRYSLYLNRLIIGLTSQITRLRVGLTSQIKSFFKRKSITKNKIWPVNKPLVSVIIPCFNYGEFLNDAIDSVLDQTFKNFEIIVIDDGSTEELTKKILANLKKPKTRLIRQHNQGVIATRNNGMKMSQGKYVCFLDADDKLAPTYLEKCVYVLETKGIDVCDSWVQEFGNNNFLWKTGPFRIDVLLDHNTTCTAAVFKRSSAKRVGGVSKEMKKGYEDWEFWLKLAKSGARGFTIPEPLFLYRKHGISFSSTFEEIHDNLCNQIKLKHKDIYGNEKKIQKLLALQGDRANTVINPLVNMLSAYSDR